MCMNNRFISHKDSPSFRRLSRFSFAVTQNHMDVSRFFFTLYIPGLQNLKLICWTGLVKFLTSYLTYWFKPMQVAIRAILARYGTKKRVHSKGGQTQCPVRQQNLNAWRYSKLRQMGPWATWSNFEIVVLLWAGVGQDDFLNYSIIF